jgi:hypothetical protein
MALLALNLVATAHDGQVKRRLTPKEAWAAEYSPRGIRVNVSNGEWKSAGGRRRMRTRHSRDAKATFHMTGHNVGRTFHGLRFKGCRPISFARML